jgi:hypothetical protein
MEGFVVLALTLSTRDDCVFVFFGGRDIGVVRLGDVRPSTGRKKVTLLFAGAATEFEILRPGVIAKRFGPQELDRLRAKYGV